jgi:hypothetical protein
VRLKEHDQSGAGFVVGAAEAEPLDVGREVKGATSCPSKLGTLVIMATIITMRSGMIAKQVGNTTMIRKPQTVSKPPPNGPDEIGIRNADVRETDRSQDFGKV